MDKLAWLDDRNLLFFCPGCKCAHYIPVGGSPGRSWEWNGSMDLPTFSPAIIFRGDDPAQRCHFEITEGAIRYLSGSYHQFSGRILRLPDWPGMLPKADTE